MLILNRFPIFGYSNMSKISVGLVIVTYNRYETVTRSLAKIFSLTRLPKHIVVVDNCSTDQTFERLILRKDIEAIRLDANLGFAAGLAAGMKHLLIHHPAIDFFWLMDDDSEPEANALENLLAIKREIPFDGILSVTGFIDTLWNGPVRFSTISNKPNKVSHPIFNLYQVDHALIDGALVDRAVVGRVGFPDGKFFMMCEDVEYCKRIKKAGYEIMLWDNEKMMNRLHFGGGGGFSKSNLWRGYYGARNHMLILKEYFSWAALLAYAIRQAKYLLASLMAPDRFKRIYLRFLGIVHGLKGISGKTIDPKDF
jgi:rhamnopyranosyl-N-acetylglucosaminyl-diphospho-decaprenol beta-1,3/1,4-galactofuranosyltransferase